MTTPVKVKKIDAAVEIFKRHLPTRDTLSKREWRALVVADMKKELDVAKAGTLGMYFAWSDQLVSGRQSKQYNRTAPRRTPKQVASAAAAPDDATVNSLVNDFNKAVAKAPPKKPAKKGENLVIMTNLTASI